MSLTIILLFCLLILHLLSHQLLHVHPSAHRTVGRLILGHEVAAVLTVPRLQATVPGHGRRG